MTISRIAMQDFKGRTLELKLTPAMLLCGANGAGKTTLIEALSIALTGCLPGMRARGMDVSTLQSLAGPSGRWSVTTMDSEGGMVRREFLGVQQRTRISAPGLEPLPDVNAAHEDAIAERYGIGRATDPAGMVSLSLSNLLAMTPEQLRAFVLDLCEGAGDGAQRWTVPGMRQELCRRVPNISELVDQVDIDDEDSALDDIAVLSVAMDAALSESRSEVRALSARRKAEIPPPPAIADIEALEAEIASWQKGRDNLIASQADTRARHEEYQKVLARQADEAVARQQAREAAEKQIHTSDAKIQRLSEALDDARAELASHVEMKPADEDLDAQKAEIAAMRQMLHPKAAHPDADKLFEMEKKLADLRAELAKADAHREVLTERMSNASIAMQRFKDGRCPTCDRPMEAADLAPWSKNIDVIDELIVEQNKVVSDLRTAQKDIEKKINTLRKTVTAHAEKHAADTQAIAAAEAELTRQHIAHLEAVSAWDQKRMTLEAKIATLRVEKNRLAVEVAALIEEGKRLTTLPPLVAPATPPIDEDRWGAQIRMYEEHLAQADQAISEGRAKLQALQRAYEVAEKAGYDRAQAEEGYQSEQTWQAVLKQGQEALAAIRAEVVGSFVGPLTSRVNDVLDGFLGTFEGVFTPRFALGMRRDAGVWVPLHRLSTGEFAIVSLAMAVAIHGLRGKSDRLSLVTFDDVEHLDDTNLPMFLQVAASLVAPDAATGRPAIDQVLIGGRGAPSLYAEFQGAHTSVVDVGLLQAAGSGKAAAEQAA